MFAQLYGKNHPAIASALTSVAEILKEQGNIRGALHTLEQVREIRIAGKELALELAATLHFMAELNEKIGELPVALELLGETKEILVANRGGGHPSVGRTVLRMASINCDLKKFQQSLDDAKEVWVSSFVGGVIFSTRRKQFSLLQAQEITMRTSPRACYVLRAFTIRLEISM